MPKKQYSIIEKMSTVWKLREHTVSEVSKMTGTPASTIRYWQREYQKIRRHYYQYLDDEAKHRILVAQLRMVEKLDKLIEALDEDRIKKAPLNQLVSAVGTITDRYLKIQHAKHLETDRHDPTAIEYYDATTGKVGTSPPWAEHDSESSEPLHSGSLWQTLRQNGIGENSHNGTSRTGQNNMVARTDLSDGESGLARFESDDDGLDWYHD